MHVSDPVSHALTLQVSQVLTLTNYGDTPAAFCFNNAKALGPLFAVRPMAGVLLPRSHALVSLSSQDLPLD